MKQYTFILNFGVLTNQNTLESIQCFCIDIPHKIHIANSITQFIFKNISEDDYISIRDYYYSNIYDDKVLYDINDIMFMSFDNYKEDKCYDKV